MNIANQEHGAISEAMRPQVAFGSGNLAETHDEATESSLTTPRIREAIAVLFGQGRNELATAVGEAAIALYPYSEDILVICSLLAEVQQDWPRAEKLLVRLIEVQGSNSTATTWLHLLRVLRCQSKFADAQMVAEFAGTRFADDTALADEIASLRDVMVQA